MDKEHTAAEIKRCAEANDGAPLDELPTLAHTGELDDIVGIKRQSP